MLNEQIAMEPSKEYGIPKDEINIEIEAIKEEKELKERVLNASKHPRKITWIKNGTFHDEDYARDGTEKSLNTLASEVRTSNPHFYPLIVSEAYKRLEELQKEGINVRFLIKTNTTNPQVKKYKSWVGDKDTIIADTVAEELLHATPVLDVPGTHSHSWGVEFVEDAEDGAISIIANFGFGTIFLTEEGVKRLVDESTTNPERILGVTSSTDLAAMEKKQ